MRVQCPWSHVWMSLVDYASYPELEPTTYDEDDVDGEWFTVGRNGRSISMNQLVVGEDEIGAFFIYIF